MNASNRYEQLHRRLCVHSSAAINSPNRFVWSVDLLCRCAAPLSLRRFLYRSRKLHILSNESLFASHALSLSLSQGITDPSPGEASARIFTYGSYRLGVHGSGYDADRFGWAYAFRFALNSFPSPLLASFSLAERISIHYVSVRLTFSASHFSQTSSIG